jgi:hypothetical protein
MSHYSNRVIANIDVQGWLRDYQSKVRHPALDPLQISELMLLKTAIIKGKNKTGVYLMMRPDESLIYIGSSRISISTRIARHMSSEEAASDFWQSRQPFYAQLVVTPFVWEAVALEAYMEERAQNI